MDPALDEPATLRPDGFTSRRDRAGSRPSTLNVYRTSSPHCATTLLLSSLCRKKRRTLRFSSCPQSTFNSQMPRALSVACARISHCDRNSRSDLNGHLATLHDSSTKTKSRQVDRHVVRVSCRLTRSFGPLPHWNPAGHPLLLLANKLCVPCISPALMEGGGGRRFGGR